MSLLVSAAADERNRTRLQLSIEQVSRALQTAELTDDDAVRALLTATRQRRRLDLSDLSPQQQAQLVASRAADVLPSVDALVTRVADCLASGNPVVVKLGIDPTSQHVHLGHAVPMLMLSRFQRMGHQAVLIIGDFTAKIGDPSGRSAERPPLTDAQIATNLATYREQVQPFFDFERAQLRRNGDWLRDIRLAELLGVLARIPVSQALQREDFRRRLDAGSGVAMSEFLYPVVMALDSVQINATIELGGVDQLLNLQMGRTVMEIHGQQPQLVVTVPLIEGIDGSGAKMGKSLDNYVALSASPSEVFGKIMSIPDRLVVPYLRAWTEWDDSEIAIAQNRLTDASMHPMELKKLLAAEVVAVLAGIEAAMAARHDWTAQFSTRSFSDVGSLPQVTLTESGELTLAQVLTELLGFTSGTSAARRLAEQGGLRLLVGEASIKLDTASVYEPLAALINRSTPAESFDVDIFLKVGRRVARVRP